MARMKPEYWYVVLGAVGMVAASHYFPSLKKLGSLSNVDSMDKKVKRRRPPCGKYGDIDADGFVTEEDAKLALRIAVGQSGFSEEQKKRADVSGNGIVTAEDALYILRYAVGQHVRFPVCKKQHEHGEAHSIMSYDNDSINAMGQEYYGFIPTRSVYKLSPFGMR